MNTKPVYKSPYDSDLVDGFTLYDNGFAVFVIPYAMKEKIGQTPRNLVAKYGHTWNVCSYVPPGYGIPYGATFKCFPNFTQFQLLQKAFELNEKRISLNREIKEHRLAITRQILDLEQRLVDIDAGKFTQP